MTSGEWASGGGGEGESGRASRFLPQAEQLEAVANAAGGFVVAGLVRDLNEGIARAREQIDSGRALAKLRALQSYGGNSS